MKKYFFLIILISCSSFLFAQEKEQFVFEKFSVEKGLSNATVRGIFQDREGYLWKEQYQRLHTVLVSQVRYIFQNASGMNTDIRRVRQQTANEIVTS